MEQFLSNPLPVLILFGVRCVLPLLALSAIGAFLRRWFKRRGQETMNSGTPLD
jgi:hypothetical protein